MAETALLGENMDISKLKVPDLKRELKQRGLSTSGNKTDLMERLQTVLKSKLDETADTAESVDDLDDDLLNDDDLEHEQLDASESVLTELDEQFDSPMKRKLSETTSPTELDSKPSKKIVLNRNPSVTNDSGQDNQNGDHANESKTEDSKDDPEGKKVIKFSELSAKERLEMRAKKFGPPVSDDAKKVARAERFALGASASSPATISSSGGSPTLDALKKRADRFGGSVSKVMSSAEQQERMERRKERFGVVTTANGATSTSDKAKQRLERFKAAVE